MGQAQQPPITVIEPENLETVFIAGGHAGRSDWDVRFWHLADVASASLYVRF